MAIDLQRFMSTMNQQPPARTSNFEVRITSKLGSVNDLTFRAESVALPGRSVSTTDFFDAGPTRKMGYSAIYLETAINFILSERYNEKEYFDQWIDAIVGPHRVQRNPGGNRFNAGYYDDYKGTIEIQNFSESGQPTYKTTLIEAFPINISPVQLDWSSGDISKLNVTFTYRYYEHTNGTVGGSGNRLSDIAAALKNGARNALKGAGQKALEDYASTGGLGDGAAPTNTAPDFSDFSIRSSGGTSISSGGRVGAGSATGSE